MRILPSMKKMHSHQKRLVKICRQTWKVRQGYYQTDRHLPARLPVRGQVRRYMELMNLESELSMASPSNCGVQPDTREYTLLLKLKKTLTGEPISPNHTGTMEIWN